MKRRHRTGSVVSTTALVLIIGVTAACGSGDSGSGIATAGGATASAGASAAAASPAADMAEQLRQFAQCMRDHGVDMPDPDPNGGVAGILAGGQSLRADPDFATAMQACRAKLPNGGEPPKLDSEQLAQYREWAQCMRDKGVDVPDPGPDGTLNLRQGDRLGELDPTSPKFQAAFTACQSKMPQFGLGGGS